MTKEIGTYNYFSLFEVCENMYAAIKKDDLCMSNAGFINMGDRVVVFDTFLSIEAAKELKTAIIELTGKEEFIIINSHSHPDHFLGNCIFPKASMIISSEIVRESILEHKNELKFGEEVYSEEIATLESKLEDTEDTEEILRIKNSLIINRNFSNKQCNVINPNLTFTEELTIHGPLERISLRIVEKGHSMGDIICINENRKVAFLGDLLFVDQHAYLGQGDPWELRKELNTLVNSGIEYFIPGHGPLCQKDKVIEQMEYIDAIISLVQNNLDRVKEIKIHELPTKFHNYGGSCFRLNIEYLYEIFNIQQKQA